MASRRAGALAGILALALAGGVATTAMTASSDGERTISFFHIHTQERLTVVYKKNGQYVPEALKQINWLMRDWRKNQVIAIDPTTIDLAWEMHEELGSQEPINVICGYRSRDTNEMLRKTVGGQASQSQHITGKAIDITFPDVPLKRMRYSALIRERGGVGYYPTSGIPFVHIDSARVRSWPRLPRYELALLFPEGHSQHMPADGGPITKDDVKVARSKYYELSVQIAQFWKDRFSRKPATAVASAAPSAPPGSVTVAALTDTAPASAAVKTAKGGLEWRATPQAPERAPDRAPERVVQLPKQVASLTVPASDIPKPKLVSEPKLVERASKFTPTSTGDRSKLEALVQQAALMPAPKLIVGPQPAVRPQKALAAAALASSGSTDRGPAPKGPLLASLTPDRASDRASASITDMDPTGVGNGWVQAPEFDEDHPEELAYRPFPLAPMLSASPTGLDPEFTELHHPDVAKTLEMIDDVGAIQPMKLRPGQQVAQVLWAQQFEGKAVHLDALKELDRPQPTTGIENRQVQTSSR